ncbi:Alpha/Beta hydrolase protein [Penicillium canariense]|uniref:Alpha/Beta hydrolase protein n=1 Tax=Penicillium canariense TaxID=189055 RepID=A0A9W9HQP8_9EURO|nr:Alpha/Beta hydrolase protein [Penicillium canariense]KAJ5153357.1 Alpha/Beta hydrolase protein [Penicillium canariense]
MESYSFQTCSESVIHSHITRPIQTNSKPLLVFLHYWGGSSRTWYKLTEFDSSTSLSALYPTVAIDLRGWGQSTGPANDIDNAYSISTMATDVATLLMSLREDSDKSDLLDYGFILVGHSMGAKVALAALGVLANDLQQLLKGLVLVGPAPPSSLHLPPEIEAQGAYESEASIRWTVDNVLANPEKLSEFDVNLVVRHSLAGNQFAKKAWPSYGMQEDISQVSRKALASQNSLRASILVGEIDVVEPKERVEAEVVNFLRQNGVEASLTIVQGVKHLIPLEDPQSIYKEVCRF